MDSDTFWLALGLVLRIEGLFPFVSPRGWRHLLGRILEMNDGQLRFFGMCSLTGGILLICLLV